MTDPWGRPIPPQQQIYLAPVVAYSPPPPRGLSIASFVLGLVSVFFGFTFLVPLIGLILGIAGAVKERAGRGFAVTGIILNGLFIVGWAVLVIAIVVGAIALGAAASSAATPSPIPTP